VKIFLKASVQLQFSSVQAAHVVNQGAKKLQLHLAGQSSTDATGAVVGLTWVQEGQQAPLQTHH